MNRYVYIILFVIGMIGFYSTAFAEECNLTVKCVCESNSIRMVPCPNDFSNAAIDCTKEGIPEGTCAVDCGQEVAAFCDEIPVECRNNETANCLVTLPVEVGVSEAGCASGETDCSGQCVDLNSDPNNCGACDNQCATGETCHIGECQTSCESDTDCTSGQYCDQDEDADGIRECVTKKSNGQTCSATNECQSGNCVDGYCCDAPCNDNCDSCNVSGYEGTCTLNADGSPGFPSSCHPYLCNGASPTCPDSCITNADCASSYVCVTEVCSPGT